MNITYEDFEKLEEKHPGLKKYSRRDISFGQELVGRIRSCDVCIGANPDLWKWIEIQANKLYKERSQCPNT